MAAIDIQSLALRVGSGDRAAESELVQHFGRRVFGLVYGRTRDAELARDLTQDTLLALVKALRNGRVQEPDNLTGFVLATARNLISNHYRQLGRRPDRQAIPDEVPAPPGWDMQEHNERTALLAKALRRLEPHEVEVLRLTLLDDLNPAQIALRLGLSSDVVRQRKSRALKKVVEFVHKIQSR